MSVFNLTTAVGPAFFYEVSVSPPHIRVRVRDSADVWRGLTDQLLADPRVEPGTPVLLDAWDVATTPALSELAASWSGLASRRPIALLVRPALAIAVARQLTLLQTELAP